MNDSSSNRNILIVDLGATYGGAEIYLEALVQQLQGIFTCYVLCSNPKLQKRLAAINVKHFALPCATGSRKVLQLITAACIVPYLLIRHRIQTVQINGYAEVILIPITRLMGRKALATRHLTFEIECEHWHQAPGRFAARFLYRQLARFASRIICVSREVGREVGMLVPADRVTVIPNTVACIPPYRSKPLSRISPVQVLFVGRLVENKGLQVLLEAMHDYASAGKGLALSLTVVGEGPYMDELIRRAAGLEVRFVGFQTDVVPFYRSADIFVSPSLGPEGSSLVVLEAMSHCVPCILSDLPVHQELSNNGQTALLFRKSDAADLARKLGLLIDREENRQSYLQAAYSFIQQHHHPDVAAKANRTAFSW